MKARNGSPPKKEAPPASARGTATKPNRDQSTECVPEWKRRRAASRRLAILPCGRSDPWTYDEVPLTQHQLECWQRTVAHLTAAGFRPIIPAAVLEVLR